MKTQLLALTAFTALAACGHAATSSTTPAPSRMQQCEDYAQAQFKSLAPENVSGTTLSSHYDGKSGYCTIQMMNKGPANAFFTKFSTNTFGTANPPLFRWHETTEVQPVEIKWQPAPQQLLCSKVTTNKKGEQVCTPYKPDPDAIPFPPSPFNDDM